MARPVAGDGRGARRRGRARRATSLADLPARRRPASGTAIVDRTACAPIPMADLLGESHHYADFCFAYGADASPPPAFVSTVKIKQAGFTRRLRHRGVLPLLAAEADRAGGSALDRTHGISRTCPSSSTATRSSRARAGRTAGCDRRTSTRPGHRHGRPTVTLRSWPRCRSRRRGSGACPMVGPHRVDPPTAVLPRRALGAARRARRLSAFMAGLGEALLVEAGAGRTWATSGST